MRADAAELSPTSRKKMRLTMLLVWSYVRGPKRAWPLSQSK